MKSELKVSKLMVSADHLDGLLIEKCRLTLDRQNYLSLPTIDPTEKNTLPDRGNRKSLCLYALKKQKNIKTGGGHPLCAEELFLCKIIYSKARSLAYRCQALIHFLEMSTTWMELNAIHYKQIYEKAHKNVASSPRVLERLRETKKVTADAKRFILPQIRKLKERSFQRVPFCIRRDFIPLLEQCDEELTRQRASWRLVGTIWHHFKFFLEEERNSMVCEWDTTVRDTMGKEGDDEKAARDEFLDHCDRQKLTTKSAVLILLEGQVGVGKSTLLRGMQEQAGPSKCAVFPSRWTHGAWEGMLPSFLNSTLSFIATRGARETSGNSTEHSFASNQ